MTIEDFGLSVLASWLAEKIGTVSEKTEGNPSAIQFETQKIAMTDEKQSRLFTTFDVFSELEEMIKSIHKPVAHILVENSPSNFYNLLCLVVESSSTHEWYVFHRGRMAFQGTGGGLGQSKRVVNIFRENKIPIAAWAIDQKIIDQFENGFLLWPDVRNKAVPLRSAIVDQNEWEWIQKQAKEVIDYDNA